MNHWKIIPTIILATVLIFGAGVFTGGILVDCVKQSRLHATKHPATPALTNAVPATNTLPATNPAAQVKSPRPPEILSKDFLRRLDAELLLTKDEHEAVQKIIADGQNAMRKVVQDSRLEIREALTAEQRQQFDELMQRSFHKPLFGTNAPTTNAVPPAGKP